MTATLDAAATDPQQTIADLQRELDARTAELQEKNERYALVSQAVAEGIYDWDIAKNGLWVSPRLIEIFGWREPGPDAGARPSQDWNARVHPDDFEHYRAALRAALKGETARLHCEYRIRLSSGEYRWVEDHALPVRDERGWAVRLVGAVSDVTDRKQQEQELREALEQQTATTEVLQVINSSPGDLTPVFDAILEKAHTLCGATLGTLFLYDGEKNRAAATHGYPEDLADELRRGVGIFPNSGPAALLAGARLVHRPDIAQVGDPVARAVSQRGGVRTNLLVPLRKDGAFLGMISCNRKEVRPYTDKEIALIENFAAQAVIAIENARLITETREALEQQTATAQILEVINRSPGNLAPVFEAMVERAVQLCEADEAAVRSFDGKLLHLVAAHGDPDALEKLRELGPSDLSRPCQPAGLYDPFTRGERVVHIADVRETEAFRKSPIARKRLQLRNIRTWLAVALSREGTLLGVINVHRHEVRPFSEKQIALLENFAAQAVIAIENARLLGELRERTDELAARNSEFGERIEHQSATIDVLKAMSASPGDPQPVFDLIVRRARDLCNTPNAGLFEFDGELVHRRSSVGGEAYVTPDAFEAYKRLFPMVPTRGSITCRAILDRQIIHVRDIATEPGVSAAVRNLGWKSQISVPLLRDGAAIGAVTLTSTEIGGFTDSQVALLQTFAEQAVIAITSAETYRELQQRTSDLQESLEYQTATSDVLKVISRSTFDVHPVLETVAKTAARLCGADGGGITLREGEVYRYVVSALEAEPELWAKHRQRAIVPGRDTIAGWVALEGKVVHVSDVRAIPDYAMPEAVAAGTRTVLGVPLLREGEVLGTINLARKRVEPYTERQIELVRTFADQAVIAIENARLLGELQARTRDLEESLEYQTAISDVLNVISRSTGDVQPVLDTVAETATRLCGADNGSIRIREGEVYRHVSMSTSAAEPEYLAQLRQRAIVPGRDSVIGRAALEGRVMHVADILADPEFARPEVVAAGRRTVLGVPLLREGAVIGTIGLNRKRVEPFTERQIELVRTFADQAVIAMENARLLGELQARTRDLEESLEYQTATSDVLKVISRSTSDVQPVMDTLVETAVRLCGADSGSIFIREGEVYRQVSAPLSNTEFRALLRQRTIVPGRETVTGRVALEGRVVQVADVLADPDYAWPEVSTAGRRTILGVPLLREDEPIGVISLNRHRVEPFSERQIELVRTFADQAAIAMENARLLGELQARTRDLEELLEYQTATSDVLKVISRSTSDVQPVMDTLVETAVRLCGADQGSILIREGEVYRYMASSFSAAEPEQWALTRQRTVFPGRGSIAGRVALEGRVVHVEDRATDPDYALPEVVASGRRTGLGVPLLRDSEPIGIIMLSRNWVEPFTERQIELVRTFADQAVIAMENARLLGELQARTDELTRSVGELQALEEVARAVNSSLDLDTVLATVIGRAVLLSQADEGMIYEFDEAEEVFVPKSAFGMSAERIEALRERRIKLGETHLGRSAIERAPVYVADVQQDPSVPYAARTLPGIHAVLAVPLLREDKVVGGLVIRRRSGAGFAPTIATLMQTFAAQSVLAIENARLFQELAARGEEARRAHADAENALADLRRAQDRLIQAEKMASLGQLTAGIAHEIKNPLNFVNNFAGLSVELLDELKEAAAPALAALDGDNLAEVDEIVAMLTGNLEKIAEHGRRADGIVKSMLEHSRGESGERRSVDLNALVEEALNLAYHGARAQDQNFNISLERNFAAAVAPIELVPQDVTRVLLNLIGNGFYAATKRLKDSAEPNFRPTLKVTTRDLGEGVEIRVRDNGAGIMPEIRDKLFQPFFTTKPTGEGTGLGLSISYDIVTQQHGGTIAVDSRVGEFTEFAIHLPRTRWATTQATVASEAAAAGMTA